MERFSERARLTFVVLTLAGLAVAGAQVPNPKNATGCGLIYETYYSQGQCVSGSGGCYYCEYTNRWGTFGCIEAACGHATY
jgi:hypothetical protein